MTAIKKSIILLFCFLLCISTAFGEGELRGYDKDAGYVYVTLGSYPQTLDGGTVGDPMAAWKWKGSVLKNTEGLTPEAEPILWRVLASDEEKIYLLSEYILFASPMQLDYKAYKKEKGAYALTDQCILLNGEFAATAFTQEELNMFLPREDFGKIFILSTDELKNKDYGFTGNKARKAWATEYAVRVTGAFVYKQAEKCCSPYWTRTQSASNKQAANCTKQDGSIGYYTTTNPEEGARPALWLKNGAFTIDGGSGTMEDPYRILPIPAEE